MSEIRATTISDAAGTGPITLTGQSAAKAWCYFNTGGTVSITDSYNVSSLTDNSTGVTTVNITNAMLSSTSFSMQVSSNNVTTWNGAAPTATSFRVNTGNSSATAQDGSRNYLLVHGDLA